MEKGRLQACADRVAKNCVALRLQSLNRLISSIYNDALGPAGITISQFSILTAIIKMQPVAPSKIAAALNLERSTLSRNLKVMRRNGWIELRGSGRRPQVALTRKGGGVYAKGTVLWERAQQNASAILGPAGCACLARALQSAKSAASGR
jgi:DNA-binding MarR family transcriptional regulator